MKYSSIPKIIIYIIAIITGAAIAYFVFLKKEVLITNLYAHPYYFAFVCLSYVVMRIFDGLRLKCIAGSMGFRLRAAEWLGLPIMMFFYSFLLPQAGLFANAVYLKSKYNSHISDYFSIGIMRTLNTLLVATSIGLISTAYLFKYQYDFFGQSVFSLNLGGCNHIPSSWETRSFLDPWRHPFG